MEKLDIIENSEQIKVLLINNADSVLGEEAYLQFCKRVIKLRDTGNDTGATYLPASEMLVSREETALSNYITRIYRFSKVVVSVVQGSVVGNFLGAILCADYRIATENSVFSFPHFKYGMPPHGALAYFLPRFVGDAVAKRILLQAKPIKASEALELNLLDRVLPVEGLSENCLKIAREFSQLSPYVVKVTKDLLGANMTNLDQHLQFEKRLVNPFHMKLPSDNEKS